MQKERKKIGIMVDKSIIKNWQYSIISDIAERGDHDIILIIQNYEKLGDKKNWHHFMYNLFNSVDNQLFLMVSKQRSIPNALGNVDTSNIQFPNAIKIIHVDPSIVGGKITFDDTTVKDIKNYQLDLILYLDSHPLAGEILKASKHGIFSLYHGDPRVIRGKPTGFHEIIEGHHQIGSVLQKLDEHTGEPIVINRSISGIESSNVHLTSNFLYWTSTQHIRHLLDTLESSSIDPIQGIDSYYSNRIFETPANLRMIGLSPKILYNNALDFSKNFLHKVSWSVLYCPREGNVHNFSEYTCIDPPSDRFYGDPFLINNGNDFIFLEERIYSKKGAHISYIEVDEKGHFSKPRTIIEKPYHLSYPHTLKIGNDYFIIPESRKADRIDMFACRSFPDKWDFHMTLMKEISAVDPTLFFHGGKWWLFANVVSKNGMSSNDELYLFYSKDIFSDDWTPHPSNPIVSDARRARPAGRIFEEGGKIVRPSQDCGPTYGYGICFNEITELNEKRYQENEIISMVPQWDPKIKGIHTFNLEKGSCVIDAKKYTLKILAGK